VSKRNYFTFVDLLFRSHPSGPCLAVRALPVGPDVGLWQWHTPENINELSWGDFQGEITVCQKNLKRVLDMLCLKMGATLLFMGSGPAECSGCSGGVEVRIYAFCKKRDICLLILAPSIDFHFFEHRDRRKNESTCMMNGQVINSKTTE